MTTPFDRQRRRRGVIGVVASSTVLGLIAAMAVFFATQGGDADPPTANPPVTPTTQTGTTPSTTTPGPARDGDLHELTEVGRVRAATLLSREDYPHYVDPRALAITDDSAFVAYPTREAVFVVALALEGDGEVLWDTKLDTQRGGPGTTVLATSDVLLVGADTDVFVLDPGTGDVLREHDRSLQHVLADRLIQDEYSPDRTVAYDIGTGDEAWWVEAPSDQPPYTLVPQQTWDAMQHPAANDDSGQLVGYGQKATGDTRVLRLDSGEVVAEGDLGEKVTDYLLYENVLYVFRNTPRELAAYSVDDLDTPLWSESLPAAEDGSSLLACGLQTLCLKLAISAERRILAIDTETGQTRWDTSGYQTEGGQWAFPAGELIIMTTTDDIVLLDVQTGEVVETFDGGSFAQAGLGVLIFSDGASFVAYDIAAQQTTALGPHPAGVSGVSNCAWYEAFVVCPEEADEHGLETDYVVWRYRS